jgi:hypothetical protein
MTPKCDACDKPAVWHAAWQTSAMSAPAFARACDEHRFEGMAPLDEPLGSILEHLPGTPHYAPKTTLEHLSEAARLADELVEIIAHEMSSPYALTHAYLKRGEETAWDLHRQMQLATISEQLHPTYGTTPDESADRP